MSRFNRRSSYIQTSYTGVSAFSADPAPSDGALAAASVIGQALKANNHDPRGLNLPSTQIKRSDSMRSIAAAQPPPSIRSTSLRGGPSRSSSLRTNTSHKRLQNHKSTPNLNARRSISDINAYRRSNQSIPKTIKRYVPGPNGLMSIEVPNPNHPDNQREGEPSNKSQSSSQQRRSVSLNNSPIPNSPSTNRFSMGSPASSLRAQNKNMTSQRKSITRSESRILSDGTKVETITTEVYVPENDNYENFDSSEIHDLNSIKEEVNDNLYEELEYERIEEEKIKDLIHENEEIEKIQRERAFSSVDEPIEDTIVVNDEFEPISDARIIDDDLEDQLYTPEERRLAQEKLEKLVAIKEKEILDQFIKQHEKEMTRDLDDSLKTESSYDLNEKSDEVQIPSVTNSQPMIQSDDISESVISEEIINNLPSQSSHSSADASTPFKSMAEHMRNSIQYRTQPPQPLTTNIENKELKDDQLEIPKRAYEAQAQIDSLQSNKTEETPTKSKGPQNFDDLKPELRPRSNTGGSNNLVKRKSVLKNANKGAQYSNYKHDTSDKYISLTTAENTRLNAMASSSSLSLSKPQPNNIPSSVRRESVSSSNDFRKTSSMTAAAKAANRYSNQPTPEKQTGQPPRPNQKVEEAKKRILASSPAQKKAKELYRLSKTRSVIRESDLQELTKDDIIPSRSSFEKVRNGESKMSKRMTMRDEIDFDPTIVQQPVNMEPNRTPLRTESKFKSRFNDDSDSDYEIPIMSKNVPVVQSFQQQSQQYHYHSQQPTENTSNQGGATRKKSESKFQKFFTEPASRRHASTTSHATEKTTVSQDYGNGEKKTGGFKKLKKLFGSKK